MRLNIFTRKYSQITAVQLKERIRVKDRVIRSSTDDVRISVINNTHTINTAIEKHGLTPVPAILLGRAMAGVAIFASFLKGDEKVYLHWKTNGPLSEINVEASRTGEVRGYVSNPKLTLAYNAPPGIALHSGILQVTNVLYNQAKPYVSTVEIAGGDIITDLEHYYKQVEQIPAVVALDTYLDPKDEKAIFSGGLIIQPFAGTKKPPAEIVQEYKKHLKNLPPVHVLFTEEEKTLQEVLKIVALPTKSTKEEHYKQLEKNIDSYIIDFHCRCSKDSFIKHLLALNTSDYQTIKDIVGNGEVISIGCQYCSTNYMFSKEDIENLDHQHSKK